ncbi:MAG: isoprenylcysteine carboxylmethyltransferase family protein [Ignavibacteriae bacterium]|nr:isoprenylcysteine carboxylmethyltransferase family protein [Ignavibacteriota bacterium]
MHHEFSLALKIVWAVVLIYWLWSARKIKSFSKIESISKRAFFYWLPLAIGALLLGPGNWFGNNIIREQFVPHSYLVEFIGLAVCIFGAFIAIWSRQLIGKNWSLAVQLKEDHELIQKGPYSLVRHPIYSGLILLFLGNAVMVGDWRGLIAVAIVFASFLYKSRKEENWLIAQFGTKYKNYKKNTDMFIPGIL